MEYGALERVMHVEASPDVVFEVISQPEHIQQWWPDEANLDSRTGSEGTLVWNASTDADETVVPITVLEVEPPHRFSFRWVHPVGAEATPTNSLKVTFELTPQGAGTTVRMTETGFREQGWEAAVLEQQYREHEAGWDLFLPKLSAYAERREAGA